MKPILRLAYPFLTLVLFFALSQVKATPATAPVSINPYAIAAPGDSVYVVQQGDTFYSLARRFNIPLDSLQHWNGDQLQAGQALNLSNPSLSTKSIQAAATAPATYGNTTPATRESSSAAPAPAPNSAAYKTKSRVLVIPFDPHLYFSDSDYEIARQSKIPRQNVRHVFRGRLNAMLAPKGYETIHLLGGVYRDSVSELSRIYGSLDYNYQDNKQSRYNHQPVVQEEQSGVLNWVKKQKTKLSRIGEPDSLPVAKDPSKHFGVTVTDPEFFSYFNNQYGIDYYVFINQFEVKTNYENCLDRAAMNYERDFTVHYSIYSSNGELVSGNKVLVPFHSNVNDVQRIVSESMPNMAQRVLADLPKER